MDQPSTLKLLPQLKKPLNPKFTLIFRVSNEDALKGQFEGNK